MSAWSGILKYARTFLGSTVRFRLDETVEIANQTSHFSITEELLVVQVSKGMVTIGKLNSWAVMKSVFLDITEIVSDLYTLVEIDGHFSIRASIHRDHLARHETCCI